MSARIKNASAIKDLALSFKEGSTIRTDMEHMAFALENMSDERYKAAYECEGQNCLEVAGKSHDVKVSKEAGNEAIPAGKDGLNPTNKESAVKKANTSIGEYWSKEASERVLHNLVRQVVGSIKNDIGSERPDPVKGAALPKEAVPNGSNQIGLVTEGAEPVAAAALPKNAVPSVAHNLDSGIVQAAHATPVSKEANATAEGEPKKDTITPEAACKEESKPAPGFTQEACGITLAGETMGYGVEISAAEQEQLNQLFA